MFDLEKALTTWRRFLASGRGLDSDDLDELEAHLRDEIDALLREGLPPERAFRRALAQMGDYATIEAAYETLHWRKLRHERRLTDELSHRMAMLKNYLVVAWRQLARRKVFTFINLCGLVVGMAACLLILLFILNELRFDAFHTHADRLYRVNEVQTYPGMVPQHVALSMFNMGPALVEDFADVEATARFAGGPALLKRGDASFLLDRGVFTEPAFFTLFDFALLQGDPATALTEPNSVVLTASIAQKMYGEGNPLGQIVTDTQERTYTVTGILEDVPANSHLQFEALYSLDTMELQDWMLGWDSNWVVTYALLREGARMETAAAGFEDWLDSKKEGLSEFYDVYLQPFRDVHLGSTHVTHDYRNFQKFDRKYVVIFGVLAFFILAIAGLNFTNISTALSAARAREVGVRKAVGARRSQLTGQFVGESVLQSLGALAVALGGAAMLLGPVNQLAGREMTLTTLFEPALLAALLGGTLLLGLLAGLYPALVLSSVDPARIIKHQGALTSGRGRSRLRSGLVVAQFTIAIAFVVGTLVAVQQLRFLQERDVGFAREQIVMIPLTEEANASYDALVEALTASPHVLDATASMQRMGNNFHQMGLRAETEDGEMQRLSPSHLPIKINYLDFYDIELVEGRGFSKEIATDAGEAFVVNEAFVADMGWAEAVGKRINFQGREGPVIGVAKNFNFNSLHHVVAPLAISVQDWGFDEVSVRIEAGEAAEALADIEKAWAQFITDRPFSYEFLDQHFAALYATEQQMSRVVGLIAGLALFIACLGLFGLASLAVVSRTKEIGIRKALGASSSSIVWLLSTGFARHVLIAFVLAAPLAYLVLQRWLDDFAYRIDLGLAPFVLAGVLALLVALATVGYHALRAAAADPVQALRYE